MCKIIDSWDAPAGLKYEVLLEDGNHPLSTVVTIKETATRLLRSETVTELCFYKKDVERLIAALTVSLKGESRGNCLPSDVS